MRWLVRRVLRNKKIRNYLRAAYLEAQTPKEMIPEVTTLELRESPLQEGRLNLLIPALSVEYIFGGINTALEIFHVLRKGFRHARIILTDQRIFRGEDNPAFGDWQIRDLQDGDGEGLQIIAAGDREGKSLAVGKGDRFIATAWWTAMLAEGLQKRQTKRYGLYRVKKFVYLIQDFEPGFYPWSARYALAASTYKYGEKVVAIFNTAILRDYFEGEGYRFSTKYAFEPYLNGRLRALMNGRSVGRRRQILVYGRPSVERNAFQLIVMGLREWVARNPNVEWSFVSVGEIHEDIPLGSGRVLRSVGKLSLDGYARILRESTIGISLMISPHPSYPPLEMAAFGLKVITNQFKGKDLSCLSDRIYSIPNIDHISLADAIDTMQEREVAPDGSGDAFLAKFGTNNADFEKLRDNVLRDIEHDAFS